MIETKPTLRKRLKDKWYELLAYVIPDFRSYIPVSSRVLVDKPSGGNRATRRRRKSGR